MTTLFISDLHLDISRPAITELFLDFLTGEVREAEALYILGDLFEVWLGDDDPDPHHAHIADALTTVAAAGTPVHFIVGNRDFLLGTDYAQRAGMDILTEPHCLDLYGASTVILHGDVLCTDDTAYQAFRTMVRTPAWQQDFLSRPLEVRRVLAGQVRQASRSRGKAMSADIMDVNRDAVAATFRTHGVRCMIHGHTHRLAKHRLTVDGTARKRIVLGDWYTQGSVLRVNKNGAELNALPLDQASRSG